MSSTWAEICHYWHLITWNSYSRWQPAFHKQNPCWWYPVLSACCLRRAATQTSVSWYFRLYLWGSKRLKWGMLTARKSDWVESWLHAEPPARLWVSSSKSPGAAPPLGPQRKTAEIENMGISIHMWSEEWVKRSMAGATEEKESTKQLEVTVRQKKFRKDFELVFWYVYISWEIEKIHMLPAGTLPDCQLYLQMISCRSIYSVESEEVHKISTTQ